MIPQLLMTEGGAAPRLRFLYSPFRRAAFPQKREKHWSIELLQKHFEEHYSP